MRPSLFGGLLPESEEDFLLLEGRERLRHTACISCRKRFSSANTRTSRGWAETQISGMCETCFDELFKEEK